MFLTVHDNRASLAVFSELIQRKSVLPEPDEPMMLITSPARACSDTPFQHFMTAVFVHR